jgi:GT2 family glycosyltransferase
VRYSIIIPVYNKSAFTQQCLDALLPTLATAGDGEVIVVDNASSDETQAVLARYPWIRLISNEVNLGFAGANNQAAAVARGKHLILLNNDTKPLPGWLDAMLDLADSDPQIGAIGAKLLFPDDTIQHGGVVFTNALMGSYPRGPYHHNYLIPYNDPESSIRTDFQVVTGACLLTPRALYERLGGLDEVFWNGYEDVDYCLKVGEAGYRVVYEPAAMLYHFESQSGVQRFRKVYWNSRILGERWWNRPRVDSIERNLRRGYTRRMKREARGSCTWPILPAPRATILVHGGEPADRAAFEAMLRRTLVPVDAIVYLGPEWVDAANAAIEVRGNRVAVFIDARVRLTDGWLEEMISQLDAHGGCIAVTAANELPLGEDVMSFGADARCTAVRLNCLPQHERLHGASTIDASLASLLLRMQHQFYGVRGVSRRVAQTPPCNVDPAFEREHGFALRELFTTAPERVEEWLRRRPEFERGLVSIITLSWNASTYTKTALESIRKYTSDPYEVIVVDNGSNRETVDFLKSIDDPHVRVIYNSFNRGYAGGNNDGLAHARGKHVVFLNNDVIVTPGWLDTLLEPFSRIGNLGVTAPRSNRVVGPQVVVDCTYNDEAGILEYAAARAEFWKGSGYLTERAIGLCLCVDRRVLDEIGGFDERYGVGNFEDDDLCIRVRGAGYKIFVCDDAFIHHFGSQSFIANKVDYAATLEANWALFAEKWGYQGPIDHERGYNPIEASFRGFDRARHFAPIPARTDGAAAVAVAERGSLVFAVRVADEREWQEAARFLKRYLRAFSAGDPVLCSIAAMGALDAGAIGSRVAKLLERLEIADADAADVEVRDEESVEEWRASFSDQRVLDATTLEETSPSALRRLAGLGAQR